MEVKKYCYEFDEIVYQNIRKKFITSINIDITTIVYITQCVVYFIAYVNLINAKRVFDYFFFLCTNYT